jgi:hypothetical protein
VSPRGFQLDDLLNNEALSSEQKTALQEKLAALTSAVDDAIITILSGSNTEATFSIQ